MKPITLYLSLFMVLAACSESGKEERAEEGDTAFDPLAQQVEKAKAVEETVEQHKRDLDEALEDLS